MSQYLLDTDHWALLDYSHPFVVAHFTVQAFGAVFVCPVTMEEVTRGRLAVLSRPLAGAAHVQAYDNLAASVRRLGGWPLAPFDAAAETQFQTLRSQRLRVGTQDLKIAAVALAHNLVLVTRNRKDFGRIVGLTLEDWSVP
jgi:tRNA(fMet)-specific endonuclease VapC